MRWFDLIGVQRHIKVLGIFSRLWHRDGKIGYLTDLPLTLDYVRDACRRYPELVEFERWLEWRVVPQLAPANARQKEPPSRRKRKPRKPVRAKAKRIKPKRTKPKRAKPRRTKSKRMRAKSRKVVKKSSARIAKRAVKRVKKRSRARNAVRRRRPRRLHK
jgi:hypothetical protein